MKTNKIISAFIATACLFSSCENLDFSPANSLSDTSFWKTEAHAKQAAVGMYNAMRAPWCFGVEFAFDMCTDLADGTTPFGDIATGSTFTSGSGGVQNHFQNLYELIHRSNTVIANVSKMDIDQSIIDPIVGEAKFMRAMAYFRMLNCWNGAPYYDETCNVNAEFATLANPAISADELRGHIIDDLNEAIEKLPVAWPATDYSRITKGAAYSLRGKVYLFNQEWTKAIADFEEVVYNKSNDYGYELHDDYDELFRLYNGKKSKEMICSIQSIDGNVAGYSLNIVGFFGNKSTLRLIASNAIVPSTDLVDMYQNLDGSEFSWEDKYPGFDTMTADERKDLLSVAINVASTEIIDNLNCDIDKVKSIYEERDPRLCINVITPYSYFLGSTPDSKPDMKQFALCNTSAVLESGETVGSPMEAAKFMRNSAGWDSYFWRKWIPTGNLDGYWGEYNRTPYEFPLIRLADVLLMLAEAYNENGELDKAAVEVNKVRARVNMPLINNGDAWMAASNKEEMTKRIRDERAFELVGEGQRYWDIRRWGMLEETVENATDIYGNLMYTREYQERHETWPFPLIELDRNPNLKQNAGW